ncbi:hypothetical protein X798_01982 [Onchocerca flexuosa]|uniref:Transposase n=2 Tax=Onchocerca flexuosa TaxID=387005 RepID=A0A183GYL9_9BILA|nr:hypothetical protein X798_01982 [Onchocerca flexuosa]VDO25418.1 unnamed protein product [Onchocerca flexuosa]
MERSVRLTPDIQHYQMMDHSGRSKTIAVMDQHIIKLKRLNRRAGMWGGEKCFGLIPQSWKFSEC